jgi:hypothetical protein
MEDDMDALQPFAKLDIDWNLTPADAVTMYLEWGNNDWNAEHPPVRSKADISRYFVVDAWEAAPMIRLVQRNSENAADLVSFPLPEELMPHFRKEYGTAKGVHAISEEIKDWLKKAMEQDDMKR